MRGSAPGERRGGRQKGSPNKRTTARAAAQRLEKAGETPLDFLSRVYRDEAQEIDLRVEAAKAAAPYVHPRLASIDLANKDGRPLVVEILRFGQDQAAE